MGKILAQLYNKSDLAEDLALKFDLPRTQAEIVLDTIFEEIVQALLKGHRVEIRGMGSFEVRKYKGYTGCNPQKQRSYHYQAQATSLFLKPEKLKTNLSFKKPNIFFFASKLQNNLSKPKAIPETGSMLFFFINSIRCLS